MVKQFEIKIPPHKRGFHLISEFVFNKLLNLTGIVHVFIKHTSASLTINENADLVVRAPHLASYDEIQKFISEKSTWINNKQRLIKAQLEDNENQHSRSQCLYLGSLYPLKIDNSNVEPISFNGHMFTITNFNRERISLPLKSYPRKYLP